MSSQRPSLTLWAGVALALAVALLAPPAVASPSGSDPVGDDALAPEPLSVSTDGKSVLEAPFAPDQLLVRFAGGTTGAVRASAHERAGARTVSDVGAVPGLQLVELPTGTTVATAIAEYLTMPGVAAAQPNYRYELAAIPDDALFGSLWGLHNTGQSVRGITGTADADIDAPAAWDLTTGSADVVVAVVDTGVDYRNPELAPNIWVNADEVPGNGLDDDGNGYIDDIRGIDTGDSDVDPMDVNGHGTHVAGTIGAQGNNGSGVAGVNWDVSIMPIKIFDATGFAYSSNIVEAFTYAASKGASVVNCSWGMTISDSAVSSVMAASTDQLFVCAAGNGGGDLDTGSPYYPASYAHPNIVVVGASDANDARAAFSNVGIETVDVFAPGVNITSTLLGSEYLSPPADATLSTVFSDDCTSTDGWLLTGGAAGSTPWALTSTKQRSEPTALSVVGYHDNELSYAESVLPLDLSGAGSPWLEFFMGLDTEYGFDHVSWGLVDTSTVPETYVELGRDSGSSATETDYYRTDLSDFAGSSDWRLRFVFTSDAAVSYAEGYLGAWIDDVAVRCIASQQPVIYENPIDYTSTMSAGLDWSTARTYTAWRYDVTRRDWYYSSSQAAENTWLFLKVPLNLASGPAELSFDAQYVLPTMYGRADEIRVYASGDNIWDTRATSGNVLVGRFSGTSGDARRTVSLAPFAGDDTVWIAFQLVTAMTTHAVSARIDNVLVTGNGWQSGVDYTYSYAEWSGTSMAAPHVSGVAGLLLARNPDLGPLALKAAILDSADTPPALDGLCVTNGRINASGALVLANRAPLAADDTYATGEGTVLAVEPGSGVLANDSDPDGDSISAAEAVAPQHGALGLDADGGFTYVPSAGYWGTDTFTYVANDGLLDSGTAVVTITVNGLPRTVADAYRTVEGTPLVVNALAGVLGNDSDPEGATLSAVVTTAPAHGSLALSSDGSFTYTPGAGWYGTDAFTYRAYDGELYSAIETATLTVSAAPVSVFRFYNFRNGTHFYTASAQERAFVNATWPDQYTDEGVAYRVNPERNDAPLHRFYNRLNGSHFYTASLAEMMHVVATWPDVYSYEGIAYNVALSDGTDTLTIYRFFNVRTGSHFYTASSQERDVVAATWPEIYLYEGVGFYARQ